MPFDNCDFLLISNCDKTFKKMFISLIKLTVKLFICTVGQKKKLCINPGKSNDYKS